MSCDAELAIEGVAGAVQPTRAQLGDVEFGWPLLQELVAMGIGHTMAVRERDVIAVEVTEGTTALIQRAGKLCRRRGWVLLKTAPPEVEAPGAGGSAITVQTIAGLAAAGARCLAVGAGRVAFADKAAVIEAADRARIAVVGVGD